MMIAWFIVLLIFIFSFRLIPEAYERMGEYGSRQTLNMNIPGDAQVLPGVPAWSNTDSVESPSLTEIQQAQIQ